MQAIVDFLSSFADGVIAIWTFAIGFLKDTLAFIRVLTTLPQYLGRMLSFIPGEILTALLLILAVVIVYKILGRD